MGPEYLFSVPLKIFYYYVQLFNKREKDRAFEEAAANNDSGKATPKMVGNTAPRPQ
jgi:hypothetical protein